MVVVITDRQAYALAREGSFVEFADIQTDARSLARQIGLAKAMHDYRLRRVISFHSRVKMAQQFATTLPEVISNLPPEHAPQGRLVFDYVSGEMATGDRRNKLNRLRSIDADEHALLANARCLSEGVDVPAIDGVAFVDPRRSQIDIVQAVGRAIRKADDKTLGTIVIPVFVPEGKNAEAVLDGSTFKPVWSVVRALRNHDELLAEQLDAVRRKKGRGDRITRGDLPPKIIIDLPGVVVGEEFTDAIVAQIVERTTSSWEEGFSRLEQYYEEHGSARVPAEFKTKDGLALGGWVSNQRRMGRSEMPEERVKRFESFADWVWDLAEAQWEEAFSGLEQYYEEHGSARVPRKFKTKDGFALGTWINNQRMMGRNEMPAERVKRLESFEDWVWDAR